MVIRYAAPLINEKEKTLKKKLWSLGVGSEYVEANDPKVVTNLSSRALSNEEIQCLANGLDYGLIPKRMDRLTIASNVEQFYHQVTDIYQHHKKAMKELNEIEAFVKSDIRILNSKELTLASDLRSITQSFVRKADDFRQQKNKLDSKEQNYRIILKNLKEDKSLIITRPDKGKGIVLMDRHDYVSKMLSILNDPAKFCVLPDDPTIKREKNLNDLLLRLHKEYSITDQFHSIARPVGSNPGRLYGLPKVHKENVPLRPVLSSIGTFNYRLAKVLTQMLSDMVEKKNIIRDSLSFVKDLKVLPKAAAIHKMVSFGITSLYTNIPIDETIEIILNNLYNIRATPPTMKLDDMKELLKFATKKSHFLFDGKVYDQIDGVSMGSPLAPLLAEIFLQEFERKYESLFKDLGIIYWKRYVDDTFVLLNSTFSAKDVCAELSKYHPSLHFTCEEEDSVTRALPFLDVLVRRQPGTGFHTCVYRKPTFSGLMTKWSSFVPKTYKYNAISSIAYRAIQLCSSKKSLYKEFHFIRELSFRNGYPPVFVNSIIRRQLRIKHSPPAPVVPELITDTVVLRVPYFGTESQVYGKRVTSAVAKQYPLKKVRVIYDIPDRIGRGFTLKDSVPDELKACVIYEAVCPTCNEAYVGQTCRHLKTRVNEHILDQKKFIPQIVKIPESNNKKKTLPQTTIIQHVGPVTRSKTGKLPPVIIKLNHVDIDELFDNTKLKQKNEKDRLPKSGIAKHYIKTRHIITKSDFSILLKERYRYPLRIKESLLIIARDPKLNGNERSMPLYIYPDGIQVNEKTTTQDRINRFAIQPTPGKNNRGLHFDQQ